VTVGSLRADALAVHGGRPEAPLRLDGLAARGTVVEEALTPFPLTLPALASLHLGQGPEFHGLRSAREPYGGPGPTLAEVLSAAGYRCAAFLGSDLLKARRSGLERGFEHYDDRLAWLEGLPLLAPPRAAVSLGLLERRRWGGPARTRPGAELVEAALRWIEEAGPVPWMVWVHLDEPRAATLGTLRESPEAARAAYGQAVAEADRQVGRLLDGLELREEGGPVLVALTSDHGELLGEDGLVFGAARSLADAAIRVPLILAGPGIAEGRRIPGQASLAELAPALSALLGVAPPRSGEDEEAWEPTRLHELAAAGAPPPPEDRAGPPVCLETAGGPASRLRGLRWAGLKLVAETAGAPSLVWVGGEGETRLESLPPSWAERLERMEAELTTCRLVAEGAGARSAEPP
jgi:arylsulfatase A-like enzyme